MNTEHFFAILDLGLIDYQECLRKQKELAVRIAEGNADSTLILCEHKPVITLGRQARRENILRPGDAAVSGIDSINVNRGGDVTLHLPGQLVIYPVFDLRLLGRDINRFLRGLEEAAVLLLRDYAIPAQKLPGLTGVWVKEKKIASIGIAVSRWITTHGVSLNVNCALDLFSLIRPCGRDIIMTSIEKELSGKEDISMDEVKKKAVEKFRVVFGEGEDKYDQGGIAGIRRRHN